MTTSSNKCPKKEEGVRQNAETLVIPVLDTQWVYQTIKVALNKEGGPKEERLPDVFMMQGKVASLERKRIINPVFLADDFFYPSLTGGHCN